MQAKDGWKVESGLAGWAVDAVETANKDDFKLQVSNHARNSGPIGCGRLGAVLRKALEAVV
jgi:hypothetical protein